MPSLQWPRLKNDAKISTILFYEWKNQKLKKLSLNFVTFHGHDICSTKKLSFFNHDIYGDPEPYISRIISSFHGNEFD